MRAAEEVVVESTTTLLGLQFNFISKKAQSFGNIFMRNKSCLEKRRNSKIFNQEYSRQKYLLMYARVKNRNRSTSRRVEINNNVLCQM